MGVSCSRRRGRHGRYIAEEEESPYSIGENLQRNAVVSTRSTGQAAEGGEEKEKAISGYACSTPSSLRGHHAGTTTKKTAVVGALDGGRLRSTPSTSRSHTAKGAPPLSMPNKSRSSASRQVSLSTSLALSVGKSTRSPSKTRLGRRHTIQPPSMRAATRSAPRLGNNYALNSASPRTLAFAVDYIGCDNDLPFRRGYLPTDEATISALERQYIQRKPPYRQVVLVISDERLAIFDSYDFQQVVHRLPLLDIVQVDARFDTVTIVEDTQPLLRSCHVMRCKLANESHAIVNLISRAFNRAFTEYTESAAVATESKAVCQNHAPPDTIHPVHERPSRTVSLMDVFNVHRDLLVTPDEEGRSEMLLRAKSQQSLDTQFPGDAVQSVHNTRGTVCSPRRCKNAVAGKQSQQPADPGSPMSPTTSVDDTEVFQRSVYRHSIRVGRPGLRDFETRIKPLKAGKMSKSGTSKSESVPAPASSSDNAVACPDTNYLEMTYSELLDSVDFIMGTPVDILRI